MVELEIDGTKVTVDEGSSIIDAADLAGIHIPRFCYHKKLSVSANCRMCLIEVEGSRKPMPACATPVTQEMKVHTKSEIAVKAQRDVMEFLLANHPLDCPICDQGGVCELQDLMMGYGRSHSHLTFPKRAVPSADVGPLIETHMTRCINCTRCVRFGTEIAGIRELGVMNRGEHAEIGTYVQHYLGSELSANIADICPVGALTTKPNHYRYRGWEVTQSHAVAPHDCLGSNIYVHSRGEALSKERKIYAIVPRQNPSLNEVWLSDRDRFGYMGLESADRVQQPMAKIEGIWQTVSWTDAFSMIAMRLSMISDLYTADEIAGVVHPSTSLEDCYAFQKFVRALGSPHVDYRLNQVDTSDQAILPSAPTTDFTLPTLLDCDLVCVVGSDMRTEQPLLANWVNQASLDGLVATINPVDFKSSFKPKARFISSQWENDFAALLVAVAKLKGESIPALHDLEVSSKLEGLAKKLVEAQNSVLFLGALVESSPRASWLRNLASHLERLAGVKVISVTSGANAAGAAIAGCLPHRGEGAQSLERTGLSAAELLSPAHAKKAYCLLNCEPELDAVNGMSAFHALEQAECVVAFNLFATETTKAYADFILPMASFLESGGTYVNLFNDWQNFEAISPPEFSQPAWKIIKVLAKHLELEGFDNMDQKKILEDVKLHAQGIVPGVRPCEDIVAVDRDAVKISLVAPQHLYGTDAMVRRSLSLQQTRHDRAIAVHLHPKTAEHYHLEGEELVKLTQDDAVLTLPCVLDDSIAEDVVLLPRGLLSENLFDGTKAVSLSKGEQHG